MSEPFYNPEGRVNNPQDAEELAYEEKRGRDAALRREKELAEIHRFRQEAEVGETTPGKLKAEFIDYLSEKYPKSFETVVDNKERKALIHTPTYDKRHTLPRPLLITRYGMVQFGNLSIGLPGSVDQISLLKANLGQITDVLKDGGGNMKYSFGSSGAVLDKLNPIMKSGDKRLAENFGMKTPFIVNMDVDDPDLKIEADKMFRQPLKIISPPNLSTHSQN